MEEKEIRIRSDGRRLDIQLSEASGLSRSRAAALMEAGYCRVDGEECRKAGTKAAEGRTVVLTVPAPLRQKVFLGSMVWERKST